MLKNAEWTAARDLLLAKAVQAGTETVSLDLCAGRILGSDLNAGEDVPPFDRSAYDGYAFRAEDTAGASRENPVTLSITETIPAGRIGQKPVGPGLAAHLMTGARIPDGADCVINFERTAFTETEVTLFSPMKPGDNIVRRGEDVRRGTLLAPRGTEIDAGLAGSLAAQGVSRPEVFRRPVIGLISTGDEVVEPEEAQPEGGLRNANRAAFTALLLRDGCEVRYLGLCRDREEEIAEKIRQGLAECDALNLTGGVSVGDRDVTPAAMERCGAEMLVRGVEMKPGMACAYGVAEGKLILGLSGNPASSLTNRCACCLPALRKMAGRKNPLPGQLTAVMEQGFPKRSPGTRFLRGRLEIAEDGTVRFLSSAAQGNAVLSSAVGCDTFLLIPAGSGPAAVGTRLRGFRI